MKLMQNKNYYDIIIENITKEWYDSMSKKPNNEKWEISKYSKSEINKAGSIIANPNSSQEKRDNALIVLNNWRAAHAYPLQVISSNLRLRNPNAVVVQRLKRLESIIGKIERYPDMSLYRMQDLGGCRVIVDSIEQVYETVNRYKNSRIRHILKREYDYIQNPKDSGYRSYHMVYQFQSDKSETYNKNMLIEIQFRTKLQHIWATAVEMMEIYTKSKLKSSQGDENILRFFTLVSSVLAIQEGTSICPNTSDWIDELVTEIKFLDEKYNIIATLSGLNVAIDYVKEKDKNSKTGYYILILDYKRKVVSIRAFKSSNIEIATKAYGQIENQTDKNVVLVSANSFDTLREAYPNYFVDISGFVDMMRGIIKRHGDILK